MTTQTNNRYADKESRSKLRQRVSKILATLSEGALEREEAIGLALLSALAGESIFLLGLPGVGKSMIARRLKKAFRNSRAFEYLMSRFSTPDEIFGPVSISKLKDADTYERNTTGYLPTSDVVFLDEIWKAGPAIQNSLLTVLNEKIFHNGEHDMKLPIKAIIAASNELPAEGEGLEALWDRFLVRYVVEPIRNKENFCQLMTTPTTENTIGEELQFTSEELNEIKDAAKDVRVPVHILEMICELRNILSMDFENYNLDVIDVDTQREKPPYVSDRRWKKAIGLMKCSALLNGRQEVSPSDCLLLEHMLWDNEKQASEIQEKIYARVFAMEKSSDIMREADIPAPQYPTLFDDKHFAFRAGGDIIKIDAQDYLALTTQPQYGEIGNDNILRLSETNSGFRISCKVIGTVTVGNYTYQLTSGNDNNSGPTADNAIQTPIHNLRLDIKENIFTRSYSDYHDKLYLR